MVCDGRDQDPQIDKGLGIDQMGFINEQEGGFFVVGNAVEELEEHPIFAQFGFFTELGDDESEEGVGIERG